MAANNVETAFRLPRGANKDFIRNLLWQHQQQQQQQENVKQRQQQNINQVHISCNNSSCVKNVIRKCVRWNRRKWFDQQNIDEEENKFTSNCYSLLEQARKILGNFFQSMSTIQSSTSETESSLDVKVFIDLFRQFLLIWNKINTAVGGSFSSKIIL